MTAAETATALTPGLVLVFTEIVIHEDFICFNISEVVTGPMETKDQRKDPAHSYP
jgi:hypothetical protein